MMLTFNKTNGIIQLGERSIPAWCKVRNEINGLRKANEVVYTEPEPHPYYPRSFPVGTWRVYRPQSKDTPYLSPFFIPTDAWQEVDLWQLADGKYDKKTGATYKDAGYGIHFSTSGTTLGCIRVGAQHDLLWLVDEITKALDKKELVKIKVVGV